MRAHLRDVIAIVALAVLAVLVGTVILAHERFNLPSWVPGIGSTHFELKAEFTSAQAVTPGQGQAVDIAGIQVGELSAVTLENGHAVITMQIDPKYAPLIHQNAQLLLRPKTGLNDMVVEVDAGTSSAPPVRAGSTVPLANTQPNVNPDEVLASLDADTRTYLQLLLAAGAQGWGHQGLRLSADLRRLQPTTRDLARISGSLAKRRNNLSHVIHNFRLLSEALGGKDRQLAEFVDSSNAVLGAFANQEASIRSALKELPPTLSQTQSTLRSSNQLALTLGPALSALRPSARALGPALRQVQPFLRQSVAPIRNQIRPFARDVQPTVGVLQQASGPLARTAIGLRDSFVVVNHALNMLAFNPSGSQESFLFWLSWFNHAGNTLFLTQDAHGPQRRGIVLLSCLTSAQALGVEQTRPFLKTLSEMSNVPTITDLALAGLC
jgi:phospholipid/cholesterol/gamma-HCH transport system substrate-binding protein